MSEQTVLRLDRLLLRNFRCFRECEVSFHPKLTVFVADNGQGKTTIMDAAAIAVSQIVDELSTCRQSDGILSSDSHLLPGASDHIVPKLPTVLESSGMINHVRAKWRTERASIAKTSRRSAKDMSEVIGPLASIRSDLDAKLDGDVGALLPVVAYYPSIRFSQNEYFASRPHRKIPTIPERYIGYQDFLSPLSDSHHFNLWYEQKFMAVKSRVATGANEEIPPLLQLTAIRSAVDTVLKPTGWRGIDWDLTQRTVVAEHSTHGTLPLASLSSGVRNMVALVADLAHRCVRLNPELAEQAAIRTPGVVLIDEVDLHLHPSWQQRVVELLQSAFRNVQFILTTHSPQVLSTVEKQSIRVVRLQQAEGHIEIPQWQTRGVESAEILARVMGVHASPGVPEAQWLSDYRALLYENKEDSTEGRELWRNLLGHFGSEHPVLSELEVLKRLKDFRMRNHLPLSGESE